MGSDSVGRSLGTLRLVTPLANDAVAAPGPPRANDQALVAAMRAGDSRAASELCDRLFPQVDRTVSRMVGRQDSDQQDLVQISLIEIVNTIGKYRGDCSLDRWVQTITGHVVFKHIRRRRLERRLFATVLADDVNAGPIQLERVSVTRELLARVADHLDTISIDRVWAFLLHDVLGYDLQEIAQMTKTSVAAAQSRLSRGRRDLHKRVGHDAELAGLLRTFNRPNTEGEG